MKKQVWHVLDVNSIWMKEFASALTKFVTTVAWSPEMSYTGALQHWTRRERLSEPALTTVRFPLQRGYARAPLRWVSRYENVLLERLREQSDTPEDSPLICSTPFYAPLAERWPGPVIYYVTDYTPGYESLNARQVMALDRRMCHVARIVCPNSKRIAAYLKRDAGCVPAKLTVVPNATRESNVAPAPLLTPGPLPADLADLPRPLAGTIGNLAGNLDWQLIEETIRKTPYLSWVFVGPATMPIEDIAQAQARTRVMKLARFVGPKRYGELQAYARCLDVAVLPYRKKEPTYSGSSTRFYEHLAACRPMVSTCGFAELLEKEPLLQLAGSAADMAAALSALHALGYKDGYEAQRWEASRQGTWEVRAQSIVEALGEA